VANEVRLQKASPRKCYAERMRIMRPMWSLGLAATMLVPTASSAGCGSSPADSSQRPPLRIQSSVPVYRIDGRGLFKGSLTDSTWSRISSEGAREPHVVLSADGRWAAFIDDYVSDLPHVLRLFDKQSDRVSVLLSRPAWGNLNFSFSPDGRWLAAFSNRDRGDPHCNGCGLYLFETTSGRAHYLGRPATYVDFSKDADAADTDVYWSQDGRHVLMAVDDRRRGEHYYQVDPAKPSFDAIEGHPDDVWWKPPRFVAGGSQIPTAQIETAQSMNRQSSSTSPDSVWSAQVDSRYRLSLSSRNASWDAVDTGHYDNCEGTTIGIEGWFDGSRYLVYMRDSKIYMVDTQTGRRIRPLLFNGILLGFFW
jgi:hypothetical protein